MRLTHVMSPASSSALMASAVLLIGGIVLLLLGLLGGSPEPLNETRFDFGLIHQGVVYALVGAALRVGSWALRRLLGRR